MGFYTRNIWYPSSRKSATYYQEILLAIIIFHVSHRNKQIISA